MKITSKNLDIRQIADSGQTFRWYPVNDHYVVVAGHRVAVFRQDDDGIEIEDDSDFWQHYLDIKRDYNKIIQAYQGKDAYLDAAMAYGQGIRILNQDAFEMIMTFIISANNNIKRITAAVWDLSVKYGTFLKTIDGVDYYDFPRAEQLKDLSVDDYRACGVGYRDKYLFELVQTINKGNFDPESLKTLSDSELKEALLRLKGVGEKVCNCIILFGYGRYDGFPVDTWIKKVLIEHYGVKKNFEAFADSYFKPYGGIAQQYLFFYGRKK